MNLMKIQSTLGFTTRGLAANLDIATGRAVTKLCQYLNSDLVFSDLNFLPLCNEVATVKVVIPSGPASYPANIAFSDHLVAKPSENSLNLATFIGFSDFDPYGGCWSQNPM